MGGCGQGRHPGRECLVFVEEVWTDMRPLSLRGETSRIRIDAYDFSKRASPTPPASAASTRSSANERPDIPTDARFASSPRSRPVPSPSVRSHRSIVRRGPWRAAAGTRDPPRRERALLLFPPGLDFLFAFAGCLGAGVVADARTHAPVEPADDTAPRDRGRCASRRRLDRLPLFGRCRPLGRRDP